MIESDVMDHPELKSACVVPVLRSVNACIYTAFIKDTSIY